MSSNTEPTSNGHELPGRSGLEFKNWILCHFDTYVRRDCIIGVYVWDMHERKGNDWKVVGYQVLVDIGQRTLVFDRVKTKEEASARRDGLLMELDQ